ncbi:MAG TPA: hypothetical protein VHN14_33660 [Kofleriaceae bacterium]|jgi:hypothetical protein|nr:hypothetical protein [Kofleriaceae bacterium]
MSMRRTASALSLVVGLVGFLPATRADTFSGFSGVDRPYLVNQDRVCTPILVANSTATGAPQCQKAAADAIAKLSIKPPIVQSGARAAFTAQATGRTITVSRKTGGTVVTWDAPDPIVKLIELYASQYDDRVAVAYSVRRAGKEVTDVVAFDLGQNQTQVHDPTRPTSPPPTDPTQDPTQDPARNSAQDLPSTAGKPAAPADPKLTKAIADARAAPRSRALAAWQAVLALDGANAEALFRRAAAQIAGRHPAEALASLASLASISGSDRADAIEWLIEARFDAAFAPLRADPKFRATVGLDRKPATTYERLMGFGGQWEQSGTSCDRPEVRFVTTRDRNFKLRVKTACEGRVYDSSFKGTWRILGDRIVLQVPTKGRQTSVDDEATCGFENQGDEEGLRCALGHEIDFVVLPTRR